MLGEKNRGGNTVWEWRGIYAVLGYLEKGVKFNSQYDEKGVGGLGVNVIMNFGYKFSVVC